MDEDIDSDDEEALFKASTALAIEKECAADAITELFSNVKTPFLPYVEASVTALLPGLTHVWADGIRKSAVSALLHFVTTFHEMSEQPKWVKGTSSVSGFWATLLGKESHLERLAGEFERQRRPARRCRPSTDI